MRHSLIRWQVASFAIAFVLTLTSLPLRAVAQNASSPFTVDDMLDVANVSVADLSDDGRWLAATSGSLATGSESTTIALAIQPTSHRRWLMSGSSIPKPQKRRSYMKQNDKYGE